MSKEYNHEASADFEIGLNITFSVSVVRNIHKIYEDLAKEMLLKSKNNSALPSKGEEPLQSLNLLKQFRNISIHYEPYEESEDNTKNEWKNFLKRAESKFNFDDKESSFLRKVYTESASDWAYGLIQEFKDWFEKHFTEE